MKKFLRNFAIFILSFILVNLIGGIMLSFTIEQVIQKDLITSVFKQTALPSITNSIGLNEEEQKAFEELMEDEAVNDAIDDISSELIGALGDENGQFDQSTLDGLLDYFIENEDKLEEITGSEVDVSQIEEFKNSQEYQDFGKQLTENLDESTGKMDHNTKNALQAYSYIVSNDFRILLGILAIVDLFFIALVQWSFYKWLSTLGKALATSGVTILLFAFLIKGLMGVLTKQLDITIEIDTSNIFLMSIMSIIIGALFIVICKIIRNVIQMKKNKEVENSEIS